MFTQGEQTHPNSKLKILLSEHTRQKIGQVPSEKELDEGASALVAFFRLLAEADQKLMKNERDKRNPNHPNQT